MAQQNYDNSIANWANQVAIRDNTQALVFLQARAQGIDLTPGRGVRFLARAVTAVVTVIVVGAIGFFVWGAVSGSSPYYAGAASHSACSSLGGSWHRSDVAAGGYCSKP